MSILKDSTLPTYGESTVTFLEEEVPFDEPPPFSQDIQDPHSFDFESNYSNFERKELFKIDFNKEAFEKKTFENNILAGVSYSEDDCSHSSHYSSTSEYSDFSSCKRIEELIIDTSKLLDEKFQEFMDIDLKFKSARQSLSLLPNSCSTSFSEPSFNRNIEPNKVSTPASPSPAPKTSLGPHTPLPSNEGYCASPPPDSTLFASKQEYDNIKETAPPQPTNETTAGCALTCEQDKKPVFQCKLGRCNLVRLPIKLDTETLFEEESPSKIKKTPCPN